jgi:oxaloacetate decarboxylase gamma subunit
MDTTLPNAFVLLIVGMTTVFIVLLLVVLAGKTLIRIINRFAPAPPLPTVRSLKKQAIDTAVVAVLSSVVDHVTMGQGQIISIKKEK